MTSTIEQGIQKVESWLGDEKAALESALEAEWQAIKPQVVDLGKTVLSQVMEAAIVFVTSGGNYTVALASVTAQLPADLVAAEHIVAAALTGAITNLQAKQAAGQPVQ